MLFSGRARRGVFGALLYMHLPLIHLPSGLSFLPQSPSSLQAFLIISGFFIGMSQLNQFDGIESLIGIHVPGSTQRNLGPGPGHSSCSGLH